MESQDDGGDAKKMTRLQLAQTVVEIAKHIQKVADAIEPMGKAVSGKNMGETSDSCNIQTAVRYAHLVQKILEQFIEFLESPLGQQANALLWKYANSIMSFVEIGASAIVGSCFLVIGQEMLDLKEEDFQPARDRIETSIKFVRDTLPKIEAKLEEIVHLLPKIQQETDEELKRQHVWKFKEDIRLAKLNVEDCEEKLVQTERDVREALRKISDQIILNGLYRGVTFGVGILIAYYAIRNNVVALRTGIGIGALSLMLCVVSLKVPYYRKLEKDFKTYERIQEDLRSDLQRLKRHLRDHANSGIEL